MLSSRNFLVIIPLARKTIPVLDCYPRRGPMKLAWRFACGFLMALVAPTTFVCSWTPAAISSSPSIKLCTVRPYTAGVCDCLLVHRTLQLSPHFKVCPAGLSVQARRARLIQPPLRYFPITRASPSTDILGRVQDKTDMDSLVNRYF